jgi:hypothetical protein
VAETFDGFGYTTCGDVMVGVWEADSRIARVRRALTVMEKLIAEYPEGVIIFQVILPSSAPPDAEARALTTVGFKRNRGKVRGLVSVAIGDSFRMSIVRTIMRAAMALSGMSSISVVEATEAAGVRRVLERAGPSTPSRAELEAALADVYAALRAAAA